MRIPLLLVALTVAGCASESAPLAKPADATPPLNAVTLAPGITFADATYAQLDAVVKANSGKVIVIDVWATWCAPCVKKFPHLVELHRKYADRGLVVISLSTNAEDEKKEAGEFLVKQNATFTNLRLADTDENEKAWKDRYAVVPQPLLHVIDRRGEKALQDPNRLRPEQVEERIEKLLAEK